MKVLIVGGGGREHALAWKFKQENPSVDLIVAPGNPGIADLGRCLRVAATDVEALLGVARSERPDLTVVGPETPLALGIVDRFREQGFPIFGPTRAAAAIESSKVFAKELMADAGVPTARATHHTDPDAAKRAARQFGAPVVIKADGLAAGKGVTVSGSLAEANAAIDAMLTQQTLGSAGSKILVEEFMDGEEVSLLFITDGHQWLPLIPAQDHKRLLDGDRGPNTGGMGAYAPAYPIVVTSGREAPANAPSAEPWADWASLVATTEEQVVGPTLEVMRHRGHPFTGVLYVGLMVTDDGIKVVEFNCRMGDPEAQVILPLTHVEMLPVMQSVGSGGSLEVGGWKGPLHPAHAVTTVVAAAGYPGAPQTGDVIHLPAPAPDVLVFHSGTARNGAGELVTGAGRVFSVTAVCPTLAAAQRASVDYATRVEFRGKQFRTDIAWRELARRA